MLRLLISALFLLATSAVASAADEGLRTLVVRERATARLLDDSFTFRVMRLKGYFVDIMLAGEKRSLKLGDSFGPKDGRCILTFHEVSPETRIARFQTNCP